jgi:hypothetical protein
LDDITGSIARVEAKATQAARRPPPQPPQPKPQPTPSPKPPDLTSAAARAAPIKGGLPDDITSSVDLGGIPVSPPTLRHKATPPAPLTKAMPPAPAKPLTRASSSNAAEKIEFGLDIGGAGSIAGLRTLWATALRRHASQLEGLEPIVHMRERPKPAGPELRLVAGPIANAATAARLCAAIAAAGALCQPALYDGQRLALR